MFLAKNGPEVTRILKTVKPLSQSPPNKEIAKPEDVSEETLRKKETPKPREKKDK